jgi:hypothetical protein
MLASLPLPSPRGASLVEPYLPLFDSTAALTVTVTATVTVTVASFSDTWLLAEHEDRCTGTGIECTGFHFRLFRLGIARSKQRAAEAQVSRIRTALVLVSCSILKCAAHGLCPVGTSALIQLLACFLGNDDLGSPEQNGQRARRTQLKRHSRFVQASVALLLAWILALYCEQEGLAHASPRPVMDFVCLLVSFVAFGSAERAVQCRTVSAMGYEVHPLHGLLLA